MQYALVRVLWDDAASDSGWHTASTIRLEPQLVTTTGYLIKETQKYILIAHTVSGDDVNGTMQIPKGMIVERKTLIQARKS